jgi:hypothetical protein
MRGPRMMIVQMHSEMMAQHFIRTDGILEHPFLKVAGKVRPKLERGPAHQMFKS